MKDGQTIGQQIKWDFKTNGNLEIRNKNDNRIYYERSDGFWTKREYDSRGNRIYYEDSNGFWVKWKWDSQGNQIHYEDSRGVKNHRQTTKPCSDKEIIIEGVKYKLVKA